MDSGVMTGRYLQETVDDTAQLQLEVMASAYERHANNCGEKNPVTIELAAKGKSVESTIAELKQNKIRRAELLKGANIDALASRDAHKEELALLQEKARRQSFEACLQEQQESQCRKKYGYTK